MRGVILGVATWPSPQLEDTLQFLQRPATAHNCLQPPGAGALLGPRGPHVSTILFETSPEHRLNRPKLGATLAGLLLALAVA